MAHWLYIQANQLGMFPQLKFPFPNDPCLFWVDKKLPSNMNLYIFKTINNDLMAIAVSYLIGYK